MITHCLSMIRLVPIDVAFPVFPFAMKVVYPRFENHPTTRFFKIIFWSVHPFWYHFFLCWDLLGQNKTHINRKNSFITIDSSNNYCPEKTGTLRDLGLYKLSSTNRDRFICESAKYHNWKFMVHDGFSVSPKPVSTDIKWFWVLICLFVC